MTTRYLPAHFLGYDSGTSDPLALVMVCTWNGHGLSCLVYTPCIQCGNSSYPFWAPCGCQASKNQRWEQLESTVCISQNPMCKLSKHI